ncbi:CRISPR-associated protein Cas4 (plasmid) [Deinococcus metallilatus]|uniref:CRISPR-associated exonuclease Cas4 n=1 Tax=Deinococcus metallilatus TaxID=1211322 RepID=A0AAJ5F9I7_9DEIO|nr:CRISPR-associated protein Cas4 [Deinococcus metallilatus]MBB5293203.1 CRISPR-associated exonuclease Cas4 [Deinococcus metallilatus]QBY06995.1 CRISPR-associated protein Cas4 [Deinococcus metallilatus]RXJ18006.1 CRISPR-associated protein Cas4 [Deinococcus metallilatus]TLK31942.1 CRISPR-associated protein Cas4 [Deinococcus metallilatus]GMA15573.1 CRISPR-associated protein Cas4 [Deinococcus metallilatus]
MSEEPIPLSGLTHYAYCPRRFALVHVEQEWSENALTARGKQQHERAHGGGSEERDGVKTLRALPLVSRQHGFAGVADVVELLPDGSPRPVEYKSSRIPKTNKPGHHAEDVQLCAQALCLEEMFGVSIPEGFIYHVASRKRREVKFTPELRAAVLRARDGIRELLRTRVLPPPAADDRCQFCSLFDACEPFAPRDFPPGYDPFSTGMDDPRFA